MLNQKEQTQKFFDAINKDSHDRNKVLQKKNEDLLAQGLKKANEKAVAQADAMIEREKLLGEQELNRTVSYKIREARANLTDKRTAITNKVFEDAKNNLLAFTEGSEYEGFLAKSAEGFKEIFPEGNVTIYVRSEDEKFTSVIKNAFSLECTVEIDSDIKIGGMRCKSDKRNIAADDTLDTRLNSQKDWFLENAGMSVVF